MKKILITAMIISSLVLSFFVTYYYGKSNFYNMISNPSTSLHIKDNPQFKDPYQFIDIIENTADKFNLNVLRQTYTLDDTLKKTTVTDYAYINNPDDFYNKINLKQGRYLTKEDNSNLFLSSIDTKDANQIGVIKNFNTDDYLKIIPFSNVITQTLTADYAISTNDQNVVNEFSKVLNEMGLETKINSSNYVSSPYMDPYLLLMSALLYLILFFLIIILFVYFIILRFKELAVRKMFGVTNQGIVFKKLLKEFSIIEVLSVAISLCITTIFLYFFNGLSEFSSFIPIWIGIQAAVYLLLLIISYPFTFLTRLISPATMLKGKKPIKLIRTINYCSKVIFSITAIVILSIIINNVSMLANQSKNIKKWEEVKNYASFWYASDELPSGNGKSDIVNEYSTQIKMQKFFQLTNNDGGFMMSPNNYYNNHDTVPEYYPTYSPLKERVIINNNYLKLNPIQDVNSNYVDIGDEYTKDMTILVPEKYMANKDEILNLYTDFHTEDYYSMQDYMKMVSGENIGFNPSIYGETAKHHEPLKVNLVFVKNNQEYFTYNPKYCTQTNNAIIDPIAIVANNCNMGADSYEPIISRGEYFGKVNDMANPQESFRNIIKQSDVERNIIRVNILYNQVDEYIYQTKNQLIFESSIFIVIIFILLLITIYTTINYIEQNKKINATKRIHGYSFFKKHLRYLTIIPIFWTIVLGLLSIISKVNNKLNFNLTILVFGCIGFMLIEILVSYLTIRLKELKKTKDILKGD